MEPFLQGLINALPGSVAPVAASDGPVLVDEPDPILFWNRVTGAIRSELSIAILDPAWPTSWKHEYAEIARGELSGNTSRILIPTSGTTGRPKFCIHDIGTLRFAATAFADAFTPRGILHSVNVLPQHHVGGLMPVLRSAVSGGKTFFANYLDDLNSLDTGFDLGNASLSLVPTQLSRILKSEILTAGLRQFGLILVGGAACQDSLLEAARVASLRLAPCYGSTETAALVTVLEPDSFLAGGTGVGKPLPRMQVSLDQNNLVQIHSESVQLGYCPSHGSFSRAPFKTNDLGVIDDNGSLHILGRADRVINTGGKKVIPEQVESICLASGLVADAWCHGVRDPDWGSRVELKVVFRNKNEPRMDFLLQLLKQSVPAYAVPKQIHPVDAIVRSELGKIIPPSP